MLTAIIAAALCAAAIGPFLLDALLCGRRAARLRLAERVQAEAQVGFVHGVGPVRRATPWDVIEAEQRLARTAWRARIVSRPRDCRERREARRALLHRRAPVRHPRHCTDCAAPAAPWWPKLPPAAPRPGLTPLEAIVADLRAMEATS